MLAAPGMRARLLRNNVGVMQDARGNYVHFGVGGNGGSDLIGWVQVTITPEMVGRTVAIVAAVETKREDWRAPGPNAKGKEAQRWADQCRWLRAVAEAGGVSCVAQSIGDVVRAVEAFQRG